MITLYSPAIEAQYDDNNVPVDGSIRMNKVCTLPDAVECTVTEELNGQYELYMVYVATGENVLYLKADFILGVPCPGEDGIYENYFRIYRIERDLGGRIYVSARHVSFDLMYTPVYNNTQGSAGRFREFDRWQLMLREYAQSVFPFMLTSSMDVQGDYSYSMPFKTITNVRAYIAGSGLTAPDKSALELFGGEFVLDKCDIRLVAQRGTERATPIHYSVNMDGILIDDDLDGVYTSFVLFYQDEDYQLASNVARTQYASLFPYDRTAFVDWTEFLSDQELTSAQILAELNRAVVVYAQNHSEQGNPVRKIEVDVVAAGIDEIYLGDSVPVIYRRHLVEVNTKMRMVAYTWNVIMQRYVTVTLGAQQETLAQEIATATLNSESITNLTARVAAIEGKTNDLKELGVISNLNLTGLVAGAYYHFTYNVGTTNAPTSNAAAHGYMYVNPDNARYGRMVAWSDVGVYTRKLGNGTWSAWVTITT